MAFNFEDTRKDFPVLESNKKLIYLDSACMSLKPWQVIEKINQYYKEYPACAGRSSHSLSQKLEEEVEKARNLVKKLINARKKEEIIFTKNTTESINLVANSLGLKKGDIVIGSDKEHNSNLIPWLKLSKELGIKRIVFDFENPGEALELIKKHREKIKIISFLNASNIDGTEIPYKKIKEITKLARKYKIKVLLDCAQSVPHSKIDVKKLDVDFIAFSGHKMLGPTGTGILYGKKKELEQLNQFLVGGETVTDSTYQDYKKEEIPVKFEAGLQNYAGIVGLGKAAEYLMNLNPGKIKEHEEKLSSRARESLERIDGLEFVGGKGNIISFNIKKKNGKYANPHEIGQLLNSYGISVRTGMHCVHSWFNKRKLPGSVRASFYFYNTEKEVDSFTKRVKEIAEMIR